MYIVLKLRYRRTPTVIAQRWVLVRGYRGITEKKTYKRDLGEVFSDNIYILRS